MAIKLTLAYDRKQLILERNGVSEELGGKYVDLDHFSDGRLEAGSNGQVLPYRVFDKDQRVSPAAVVENKRLGLALSVIKAKQDAKLLPKVQTNSEKERLPQERTNDPGRAVGYKGSYGDVEITKKRRFRTFPQHDRDLLNNDKPALQFSDVLALQQ